MIIPITRIDSDYDGCPGCKGCNEVKQPSDCVKQCQKKFELLLKLQEKQNVSK